jgi:hypothetical protein
VLRGYDFTLQLGYFFLRTPALDLGVTGALSVGYVRSQDQRALAPETHHHYFIRPMAAGALLWKFTTAFRLRALFGLTQLQDWAREDSSLPALYAAAGIDFGL